MTRLTISQVARSANVNVETIKYYEKRGLLAKPERSSAGYRLFPTSTVDDIMLIKKAQEIGFTLDEIKQLQQLITQEHYFPVGDMHAFATAKIDKINEQIVRLEAFRSLLEQAIVKPVHSFPHRKQACPVLNTIRKGVDHGQND